MEEIPELRKKIDLIDEQILKSLRERQEVSREIGRAKRKLKIQISDSKRENEVFGHVLQEAAELGLDTSKIRSIYREIISLCSNAQKDIPAPSV